MEKNFLKIWKDALLKKQEYVVGISKKSIPPLIKEFKGKSLTTEDKKRLKILEDYYAQTMKFEKILKRIITEFDNV